MTPLADVMTEPKTFDSIDELIKWADGNRTPPFWLVDGTDEWRDLLGRGGKS